MEIHIPVYTWTSLDNVWWGCLTKWSTNWVFNKWYGPQASISLPRTMDFHWKQTWFIDYLTNWYQSPRSNISGKDGGWPSCVYMNRFGQHLIKLLDLEIERTEGFVRAPSSFKFLFHRINLIDVNRTKSACLCTMILVNIYFVWSIF